MDSLEFDVMCPYCGLRTDRVTAMGRDTTEKPKPGDWTICFFCGAWLVITEKGARKPTVDEILAVPDDAACEMRRVTRLILSMPPRGADDWIDEGRPTR